MTQKSSRDIEFAIRLAIEALRREMTSWKRQSASTYDQGAPDITNNPRENRPPDKHQRDVERAIAILKAIKVGIYDGE
jgi:hypothetical protein